VDNGSTDDTVDAVRNRYPEVHVIENGKNLGYAEGNNVGIRCAIEKQTDFILILNNDTAVQPFLLDQLYLAAKNNPKAGILSPVIYFFDHPNQIWFAGGRWSDREMAFVHEGYGQDDRVLPSSSPYATECASGCAMFFGVELVKQVGLFDPRFFLMWEETDWCFRARQKRYQIMIVPEARVYHKTAKSFEGGGDGPLANYYLARNRFLWIEKNLKGHNKVRAYLFALRRTKNEIISAIRSGKGINDPILSAKLTGLFHYIIRRFGQGPTFEAVDGLLHR